MSTQLGGFAFSSLCVKPSAGALKVHQLNSSAIILPLAKKSAKNFEGVTMKRFLVAIGLSVILFASFAGAQTSGHYSVEDLLKIRRVGDPQISPDGKRVVFTIGDVDVDANRTV